MPELGRIGFSEYQADLLVVATEFCRERSPIAKVRQLMTDERGYDPDVWDQIAALGWLGVAIPEVYGGSGLTLAEVVPIMEQMGRYLLAGPFFSTTLVAQAVLAAGSEAQKSAVLPKIAQGARATLALMEEEGGWNLEAVACTATAHGAGRLALSGAKILVGDALDAEWFVVSVVHAGAPQLALVSKDRFPKGAFRAETLIDETKRSCRVDLEGVEIAASDLFDPALARSALHHLHLAANLLAAAEMCGGTQAVIDVTLDYLKTRRQFGKLIGSYQALKHPIVDAYVRYEQARSHLYSAAHSFDQQGAGEIAVRMAKAQADAAFAYAADRAIQFHGGFGFTYDCDAQLFRRRAIWHTSQYGDAVYHRRKLANLLF